MPLRITDRVFIHIVADNGISHAVKGHGGVLLRCKFLIGFFDRHGAQIIDIFHGDLPALAELQHTMYRHRPQHTPRGRNADLIQLHADRFFQFLPDLGNGFPHQTDIMDLSVQHGPRLMLSDPLGETVKLIALFISHRPHDASRAYIQPEDCFPRYLLHFCH